MSTVQRRTCRGARAGLTLVEVMIAIMVLQVAVLALSYTLATGEKHVLDAEHSQRASRLALDLIEEIIAKAYSDPQGGDAFGAEEGSRSSFDDVDDYHGFSEATGAVTDFTGSDYGSDYQSFSRSVAVTQSSETISALSHTVNGKYVVVTVTDAAGRQWSISRLVPEPAS